MFPFPPKGRRALFIVHDPKLHAWTLRIDYQNLPSGRPDGRRPHRGVLADVDFSMAAPAAVRKPLLRRIIEMIRRERRLPEPEADPDAALSGSSAEGVGKTVATLYGPPLRVGGRRAGTEHSEARAA